jgi:hypothetical protein
MRGQFFGGARASKSDAHSLIGSAAVRALHAITIGAVVHLVTVDYAITIVMGNAA